MKIWKKPLATVLAGMLCVISMPQVQPLLPAFSAAAARGNRNCRGVDVYPGI